MNSYILLLLFLLLLIYIVHEKINNSIIIIQSEGKGYEWGGIKLKHIFKYAFRDKTVIFDVQNKYKPDLVIKSHFGERTDNYTCPYILWSGEAVRVKPNSYPPLCEINTIIVEDPSVKSFYIPYALWTDYKYENVQGREHENNIQQKKYDFVYISKNCQEHRENLFKELKSLYNNTDKIHSLGDCQRTHDEKSDRDNYPNNKDIYKNYKFVFCMENTEVDGYITEKIMLGFLGKSIPIYYGTNRIKEIFNENSFFYINDYLKDNKSWGDIAHILKNLADDDSENGWKKYLRQPIFRDNIEPDIFKVMNEHHLDNYTKEIGDYIRQKMNV